MYRWICFNDELNTSKVLCHFAHGFTCSEIKYANNVHWARSHMGFGYNTEQKIEWCTCSAAQRIQTEMHLLNGIMLQHHTYAHVFNTKCRDGALLPITICLHRKERMRDIFSSAFLQMLMCASLRLSGCDGQLLQETGAAGVCTNNGRLSWSSFTDNWEQTRFIWSTLKKA